MKLASESPYQEVIYWLRIVFGVHLIYSGLAFILSGWEPTAMLQAQSGSGQFMVELDKIGMYPLVKYLELLTGLMLVADISVPLALILEFPITLMIFYLNVVVEGSDRQLFTGPQELFLNGSLLLAYGGYYAPFLRVRAPPAWLWHSSESSSPTEIIPVRRAGFEGALSVWLCVAFFSLLVVAASWLLGPPERQLPPRDYVPLLIATVALIWLIIRYPMRNASKS